MNFSNAASDSPSMSIAFWLTKWTNFFSRRVSQSGLSQYSVLMMRSSPFSPFPLDSWMRVGCPQQGQTWGIVSTIEKPPLSRFSSTWGMIMFRLLTRIRFPAISSRSSIKDRLCRLALLTSQPSISTGVNTATGAISPVLPGVHSMYCSRLSCRSSSNL